MSRDIKIPRHPSKPELLAYVENLIDSRSPISAKTAAHIAACGSCQVAVRAIRSSLEFAQQAPALEPSKELTNQILLAAQSERAAARTRPAVDWRKRARDVAKGLGLAAGLAIISTLYFGFALRDTPRDLKASSYATVKPVLAMAPPSPDVILKTSAEVKALALAVSAPSGQPQGLLEREYRRQVQARDADISRAVEALQQNPRCVRASYLLNSNLQRQAEILRKLYAERNL